MLGVTTSCPSGVASDPLRSANASQGIFIWSLGKLGTCHVSKNPFMLNSSNTPAIVAKAYIDLNTNSLIPQIADTPGCIDVITAGENSNLLPRTHC